MTKRMIQVAVIFGVLGVAAGVISGLSTTTTTTTTTTPTVSPVGRSPCEVYGGNSFQCMRYMDYLIKQAAPSEWQSR